MDTTDSSVDNPTRRTDLRTVEHASAREVYAALDCPFPGDGSEDRTRRRLFYTSSGRGVSKATGKRPTEGTGSSAPVPSATTGINASPSSSDAAVRRRTEFSGFESDDNARYNPVGTMKTTRHHGTDEPRDDHDADARELLTDGGQAVRADAVGDDLPRASIRSMREE